MSTRINKQRHLQEADVPEAIRNRILALEPDLARPADAAPHGPDPLLRRWSDRFLELTGLYGYSDAAPYFDFYRDMAEEVATCPFVSPGLSTMIHDIGQRVDFGLEKALRPLIIKPKHILLGLLFISK